MSESVPLANWNLSKGDPTDRIQQLAANLPLDGAVRIEYDAYPGFRFQDILRDLAGYHCREIQNLKDRREQTMAILGFVAGAGPSVWIRELLEAEIERLKSLSIDEFDWEFALDRRAYRQAEVRELFAPHGLACNFVSEPLSQAGSVVVRRSPACAPTEAREPNALYHELVYPEYLHAGFHPERLATMARIFGLNPPPIENCRVLELGCSRGITMLNTALDLRSSRFVGIDFSEIQIAEAKRSAQRLGLDNVEFHTMDIANFDASLGQFDYIIAHGMYSWLPTAVREKMLAVFRDHLSPTGIAYISFNTNPGYRLPAMIRDYALDTASGEIVTVSDAAAVVERVRDMPLNGLTEAQRKAFELCREHFLKCNPAQMIFDELADVNQSFGIDEFASDVSRYGLRYVAESEITKWSSRALSQNAQQLLDGLLEDPVRRMQYRDFLHLSRFHASVLCRDDRKPSYAPIASVLETLLISSQATPHSPNPDVRGTTSERFESPGGVEVSITDQLLKAALVTLYLGRPRRYPFADLLREASELADVPADAAKLRQWLQPLWETGLLDLHCHMPAIAFAPGDHPVAAVFARLCASETRKVPSMLGSGAELPDETDRALLQLLDGSRDLKGLERQLGLNHDDLLARLQGLARLGVLIA